MSFIHKQDERTAQREAQARARIFISFIQDFYDYTVHKPCELDLTIDDKNPTSQFRRLYSAFQEDEDAARVVDRYAIDIDKRFRAFQEQLNFFSPLVVPYSESYERIFTSVIESEKLQQGQRHLVDFVFERYWEPVDLLHIRYNWQILQERVNQLKAADTPEVQHAVLPRLNAAIDWLKDYEQRLAPLAEAAGSPWEPLLISEKMRLDSFFDFLADCGLMNRDRTLTPLGQATGSNKDRKAPWAGTLTALIQSHLLERSYARICRAMEDPAGQIKVKIAENTVNGSTTKGTTYFDVAERRLKELGLLRN